MEARTEPYRILAVDGGGVGGIIPARLIERLANAHPGLLEKTDLFAGTSTGGLISIGLALGKPPSELVAVYRDRSEEIFGRSMRRWKVQWLTQAKFRPDGLRKVVSDVVGESTLGDIEKRNVFVPVTALKRADSAHYPAGIFLSTAYRLFPDAEGETVRYRSDEWRCLDVAMATSAAPTYFPAHVVRDPKFGDRTWRLWDGGVVANHPGLAAVCELARFVPFGELDVRVLSLGTGYQNIPIEAGDWGQAWAAVPVIQTLMDTSVGSTNFYMRRMFGDKMARISPVLSDAENYEMDDPAAVPRLMKLVDDMDLTKLRTNRTPPSSLLSDWLKDNW